MKKLIAFVLTVVCMLSLVACNHAEQGQAATYSFRGEHDYFEITNGSILLSDTEEVFDGGNLQITQSGMFEEVTSCSTTFYTCIDGAQRTLLSNRVTIKRGGFISIDGDLGSVSGKGIMIGSNVADIEELRKNLWFELKTTDLNGEENVYQIQLTLID